MNPAAQQILFSRLQSCANTLEARAEAGDLLNETDMMHLAQTLRDLAELTTPPRRWPEPNPNLGE